MRTLTTILIAVSVGNVHAQFPFPNPNGDPCMACPDGSSIPEDKRSLVVGESEDGDPITCGLLSRGAATFGADSEECGNIQLLGSAFCGCPVLQEAPEGKCNLCASGTELSEEQLDTVIVAAEDTDNDFDITCRLQLVAGQRIDAGTEECDTSQGLGVARCGCDPNGKVCTVCPDGSPVPDDKLNVVATQDESGNDLTCQDLALAAFALRKRKECTALQSFGSVSCGCPPAVVPEGACSLCIDGTPLEPANAARDLGDGLTCALLNTFLPSQYEANSTECKAAQATAGAFCGCAYDASVQDQELGICRVCGPPGSLLPDPTRVVKLAGFGSRASCASWEAEIAVEVAPENGCGGELRQAAADACCGCVDSSSGRTVEFFQKIPESREGCDWLASQNTITSDLYCSNFEKVQRGCPSTCNSCPNNANCEDKADITFPTFQVLTRSCKWLAGKKELKKKKLCRFSPDARKSCQLSCGTCS